MYFFTIVDITQIQDMCRLYKNYNIILYRLSETEIYNIQQFARTDPAHIEIVEVAMVVEITTFV